MAPIANRLDRDRRIRRALCLFLCGYVFAARIFSFAEAVRGDLKVAILGFVAWAVLNGTLVYVGVSEWPLVSLALGFMGACAIIATAAMLAQLRIVDTLRFLGEHSIVIYLAFFLPMAATRTLLLKTGLIASTRRGVADCHRGGDCRRARDLVGRRAARGSTSCSAARSASGSPPARHSSLQPAE